MLLVVAHCDTLLHQGEALSSRNIRLLCQGPSRGNNTEVAVPGGVADWADAARVLPPLFGFEAARESP